MVGVFQTIRMAVVILVTCLVLGAAALATGFLYLLIRLTGSGHIVVESAGARRRRPSVTKAM